MNENQENRVNPDEILAQMAQDVPEMPADFHARPEVKRQTAGRRAGGSGGIFSARLRCLYF